MASRSFSSIVTSMGGPSSRNCTPWRVEAAWDDLRLSCNEDWTERDARASIFACGIWAAISCLEARHLNRNSWRAAFQLYLHCSICDLPEWFPFLNHKILRSTKFRVTYLHYFVRSHILQTCVESLHPQAMSCFANERIFGVASPKYQMALSRKL